MIAAPVHSYTTTDLRRADVLSEAFDRPVAVRDGKSGHMLVMLPMELIERSNSLNGYTQLLCRVLIECQRPDPSPAVLGPVAYICDWSRDRQTQFIRGLAEALAEGAEQTDPAAVAAYIEVMSHADDHLPTQFDSGSGTKADRKRARQHVASRSTVKASEVAHR